MRQESGAGTGGNLNGGGEGGFGRHPYRSFLGDVERPSRYIGGEHGQTVKRAGDVDVRVCLSFPDVYEVGMSHLGTRILYALLNGHPRIACERAFSPWPDMEAELRRRGLPLVSLETATPLAQFDVLGFSLQYELCYTNVLQALDLAGLPLRAVARRDDAPLVLAGGPTALHAEPLSPFVDAFFIGEAEDELPALVLEAAALRRSGMARRERLARLAAAFPLHVPELHARERDPRTGLIVVGAPLDARVPPRVRRAVVADLDRHPFPEVFPVPYTQAIFDRMAVEIARGCTEGCRFCQAGVVYRPVRERDPGAVLDALLGGLRRGGHDEASITSLSPADYTCIAPLVRAAGARLRAERASLSISSLRAYGLQEDLLAAMATTGANGLTLAPEAGSQRLRDVISKNITEADLLETAERAFSRGFQRLKLYFMVGLPTETDEDVAAIIETAARVLQVGRRITRAASVTASVSTFVPKPHTPLQWAAMDSEAEIARKHDMMRGLARRHRIELRVHDNFVSHLEAAFSRGDAAMGEVLERAYHLGCRFDGWDDQVRPDLWRQAMDELAAAGKLDAQRYLANLPLDVRLPWDHVDVGVTRQHLLAEYKNAMAERPSPACGKPLGRPQHPATLTEAEAVAGEKLVCTSCGAACDLEQLRRVRLERLRRIEAVAPPPSATSTQDASLSVPSGAPEGAPGAAPRPASSRRQPRPAARLEQGQAYRYRLRYTKRGGAAFLGHLDVVRQIPRMFRRADLVMHHSEGFHPKPEMTFGPALGLGMASLGEFVDVKLDACLEPRELLRRLRGASMSGLELLNAATLVDGDRALGRIIDAADFAAWLPEGFDLAPALAAAADGRPLQFARAGDGQREPRTIDVRRALLGAAVVEDAAVRDALDWPAGPILRVRLALPHDGGAGVRPAEAFTALLGEGASAGVRAVARLALWSCMGDELVDPMDVERLRRPKIAPTGVAPPPDLSNDPVSL